MVVKYDNVSYELCPGIRIMTINFPCSSCMPCDMETNNLTNKDIFSLCDPDGVRTHSAGSAECSSAGVILIRSRQNLWSGDSWRDTFYPPVLPRLVDGGAWQLVWSGAVTPHASTDNLLLELERLLARYLSRGQPPPRSRASPSASP